MSPVGQLPRILNPIWLISLFLGLTEITTGIAATQTSGWPQIIFTIFSVAFPAAIAAVFFLILWSRPAVLYAPGDYTEQTSVSTYVAALSPGVSRNFATIEAVVRSAIETTLPQFLTEVDARDREDVVDKAVEVARADLNSRSIEINLSLIDPRLSSPLKIPVTDQTTVSEVLNEVWFNLRSYFDPLTINKEWRLVEADTGRVLDSVGIEWARKNLGTDEDRRLLAEAEIFPGDRWIARRIRPRAIQPSAASRRRTHP